MSYTTPSIGTCTPSFPTTRPTLARLNPAQIHAMWVLAISGRTHNIYSRRPSINRKKKTFHTSELCRPLDMSAQLLSTCNSSCYPGEQVSASSLPSPSRKRYPVFLDSPQEKQLFFKDLRKRTPCFLIRKNKTKKHVFSTISGRAKKKLVFRSVFGRPHPCFWTRDRKNRSQRTHRTQRPTEPNTQGTTRSDNAKEPQRHKRPRIQWTKEPEDQGPKENWTRGPKLPKGPTTQVTNKPHRSEDPKDTMDPEDPKDPKDSGPRIQRTRRTPRTQRSKDENILGPKGPERKDHGLQRLERCCPNAFLRSQVQIHGARRSKNIRG